VSEPAELYTRYKGLALAVGAGLLLDADGPAPHACSDGLGAETLRLAADADALGARTCHQAALALHRLAVTAAVAGTPEHPALIEDVRASHRALRAELWDDVAHHYAPCGAHRARQTDQEHVHV
jgi:hypothetical protein